uniref:BCL3-1 n=1 Tax=Dendrocoelum lacteum TaxID=27895 RepID=T1E117_9PLAT
MKYYDIEFLNFPQRGFKFRSDSSSTLKDENQKIVSIKISNVECRPCKLVIKLLLKEPEDQPHFYQLYNSAKDPVKEVEYEINETNSVVKLDFFGIKKALKKDALKYLKEIFKKRADDFYKKNASTIILQISVVDPLTRTPYNILKYEMCDKNDNIVVKAYSPGILLYDDNEFEITFLLENPEKDSESIFLELDFCQNKIIPKELPKPTSIKNVFVFSLKHITFNTKKFKARLCRKRSNDGSSDWIIFTLEDRNIEMGKRKRNKDDEGCPQYKIPRQITPAISENGISEYDFDDYFSDPASSLDSFQYVATNKQLLKNVYEKKMLSKIARVGHDFAFGLKVTKFMDNVLKKLPVVFIIQDDVGDSPLHNAILKNQEERAMQILDIVSTWYPEDLFTKNTSDHTALILAPACDASPQFVTKLLSLGFSLKDKDIDGNNALTIAIEYKNINILETLVQNASETKVFTDCVFEIKSLIRKTVVDRFFEGFKIFWESSLVNENSLQYLDASCFDLDFESTQVFEQYCLESACFTPLPELGLNDILNEENFDFDMDTLFCDV